MSIIVALLIFGLLIFIHELGHFLLAKRGGIGVTSFSLGMGPAILKKQIGETEYALRIFPFGGSCVMVGEDTESDKENAFNKKGVWTRISVVAAGPLFNFILAFAGAVIMVLCAGVDKPVIMETMNGYPAYEAGVRAGDEIISMNGRNVGVYRDVSMYIQLHQGETVDLVYERDGVRYESAIVPKMGDIYEESAAVSGFAVFINMLNMVIFLSANLGVMNLLPIPALDGGRLFVMLIEVVTRKRVPEKVEGYIHMTGFVLLMGLMVLILFNDISLMFFGQ